MEDNKNKLVALTELNEQLENYFRNTIIPQLFVDADLVLRKFTPPAMKQFSLKEADLGRHVEDIKENFRFPTFVDNINHVIQTGDILEKEIQTLDRNWFQMNILPYVVRSTKKTNGVIITFMDITARIKDLKEQERMIAEHELLLDTIAHDIKGPLTSMGLAIEVLKKLPEKGMEKFPALLMNVDNSLQKMKLIIFEQLQSRWTGHPYMAVQELVDLQNILEDVRLTLAPQIQESGAVISYHIGISEITFVRRKLRSVIYNLVNNAMKFHSPEQSPKIHISSVLEDGFMVISVIDNGMGMSDEVQQSIFDKYQRVDKSIEGNGVGLYLVKEILESVGGKIEVESQLGKGSTFKVYLKLDE